MKRAMSSMMRGLPLLREQITSRDLKVASSEMNQFALRQLRTLTDTAKGPGNLDRQRGSSPLNASGSAQAESPSALAARQMFGAELLTENASSEHLACNRREESNPCVSGADLGKNACHPDELLCLKLDAEVTAEEFFHQAQGKRVVGQFVPTSRVSFAHVETEWDVGEIFSEAAEPKSRGSEGMRLASRVGAREAASQSISQSPLCASAGRLRAEAESRGWLSPKSSSALDNIKLGYAKLTRPELNALHYLLTRAKGTSRLAIDIDRIHKYLADQQ
ncbi:hypothetical protein [Mesorhizobium neociceri]|uniref:Uncharacterized protein n=1 Tax=Mesorhizobium neociceri TaxID=1307853 RepID=A0A838B3Z0_9HYPH|nr:hypothetical protein [Mesorhizobium neociceri]MBA1140692.1 hypothetical protein [Mesorhizobium neociceri]